MNKGLLVIGGGILQIPALRRARDLGIATYLSDGSPHCSARRYADEFFLIDVHDIEGNTALARELRRTRKIVGVYTQGADFEYTVASVAKNVGLFGIDPRAALNCNNKILCRKVLSRHGMHHTEFASAKTLSQFGKAMRKVGFPCYVKPADNSASRGVTRLTTPHDGEWAFRQALEACYLSKEVIVEAEIAGEEYSVDTVLYSGRLYPGGISDRIFLKKRTYAVQAGSRTPSLLPSETQRKMYDVMQRAAGALGVMDGALKGDLVVDPKGNVRIIEVTARTSGGFDSQMRKPLSFGIDLLKATMDIACGKALDPIDLVPKWVKWSSTISVFPNPGTVVRVTGMEAVRRMNGVHELIMLAKPGSVVEPYTNCAKRTNYVIACQDTLEALTNLENRVLETLRIVTKK